jgi:hypothetical protein
MPATINRRLKLCLRELAGAGWSTELFAILPDELGVIIRSTVAGALLLSVFYRYVASSSQICKVRKIDNGNNGLHMS